MKKHSCSFLTSLIQLSHLIQIRLELFHNSLRPEDLCILARPQHPAVELVTDFNLSCYGKVVIIMSCIENCTLNISPPSLELINLAVSVFPIPDSPKNNKVIGLEDVYYHYLWDSSVYSYDGHANIFIMSCLVSHMMHQLMI